jgi:hypothetical protein
MSRTATDRWLGGGIRPTIETVPLEQAADSSALGKEGKK